ncbi:uncharacterized protein I206_102914 [Kwoniella pini CBS 10737]|uniref:WSC domain-containing protein n=1 Tax=Kwoniella pini CBS 10737 TaxID=1296096 RepID=A0A1B9I6T6_9TREE|nr:uncharacterized protein I206_03265 [Kwoniella pini CBS 10737]OCF51199.1 hypothetical protein I206_03265 [Kwoniella pini CBS 10737]
MRSFITLFTILNCLGGATAASDPGLAAWHLDNLYPLATERLDPVVAPNGVASHLHRIVGGSNFGANYNYDQYNSASCSSAAVQADKSNYWMPQLFWKENSTFVPLKAGTRFYYFLHRNNPDQPVRAFPPGLRMLVGNLNAKNYADTGLPTGALNFICLKDHFSTPNGDTAGPDFNFNIDCPQGLVTTVRFPTCWDGVNLYKSDGSHMAYTNNLQYGVCPISHPVRLPGIMLEYTWQTYAYKNGVPLKGNLIWANGDTTGYALHSDFVNGWDTSVLEAALNDPACLTGEMTMTACPTLAMSMNLGTAQNCQPQRGVLESYADFAPISSLPGCNLPWASGPKPACNPPVGSPTVPNGLKGTDGSLTYSGPSYTNTTTSPPGQWTRQGCIGGATSLTNSFQYSDAAMTQAKCQSTCGEWGMQYSGLLSGAYCVCGSDVDKAAYHFADSDCNSKCGGDSTKTCGGNGKLELFRNPSATTVNHPGITDPQYIGCRREGGNGHALSAAYINYDGMTIEWCKNYCKAQKQNIAGIELGRTCTCGNDWTNGGGVPYPQDQCNVPCKGNTSQICGGSQITISTFNLTLPGGSSNPSSSASVPISSTPISASASATQSGVVTITKTVTVTGSCSTAGSRRRNHRDLKFFADA